LDITRQAASALKDADVDGCFHYYDNNWHYVRKWEHLKDLKSLYPLSEVVKDGITNLSSKAFLQSDHYIGRNISCLIKLSWTEEQVIERADKMAKIIITALKA
jgi:8-amino-3,8-dideoxy-alpha-D-manno-octulosonate transaminase